MGNLAPRGGVDRHKLQGDECLLVALNLEPVKITRSHSHEGMGFKEISMAKSRGIRARFPSNRTLRSMANSSKNSFSVLSDD